MPDEPWRSEPADFADPAVMLQVARIEADEIRKRAYEEGWQRGYREGLAEARDEADQIRDAACGVLREAEELRRRTLDDLSPEIRALAVSIAEKLVAGHLEQNPETIAAVAREALETVRDRQSVVLYAHPSHVAILLEAVSEFKALLPEGASLRIIADAGLERGGCLVETEQGLVDATTQVRWREVLRALEM